jgi:hypothetical protein
MGSPFQHGVDRGRDVNVCDGRERVASMRSMWAKRTRCRGETGALGLGAADVGLSPNSGAEADVREGPGRAHALQRNEASGSRSRFLPLMGEVRVMASNLLPPSAALERAVPPRTLIRLVHEGRSSTAQQSHRVLRCPRGQGVGYAICR